MATQLKSSFRPLERNLAMSILSSATASKPSRRRTFGAAVAIMSSVTTLLSGLSASARAQLPAEQPSRCYGFAFGSWTPPLDWSAAGHGPPPAPGSEQRAPAGRAWAFNGEQASDTLLILVPSWWPAGVVVSLPNPPRVGGDTVITRATALVANGERRAPVSRVRVWAVACR
jgi:hypothetical protein